MRLLDSRTLELKAFFDDKIPKYAVLSHTWGKEEVSFQDMQGEGAKEKAGYSKIKACCATAARNHLKYVWIDTCCIDKTSSAELSEAINSMYRWYQAAAICYAYLADVPVHHPKAIKSAFQKSRWFTRGWTLQELIAPLEVVFYADNWHSIGTKTDWCDTIKQITGVSTRILTGRGDLRSVNVATKMSWASKRKTTKLEDTAYCLMGLFNINMPLLYGEGQRAFVRLQEEILKISNDHSLFAWKEVHQPFTPYRGLLARSPTEFVDSGNITSTSKSTSIFPITITNRGLHIQLDMIRCSHREVYGNVSDPDSNSESESQSSQLYLAALQCQDTSDSRGPVAIYLGQWDNDMFIRMRPDTLTVFGKIRTHEEGRLEFMSRSLYIPHNLEQLHQRPNDNRCPIYRFHIQGLTYNLNHDLCLDAIYPHDRWDGAKRILKLAAETSDIAGLLLFKHTSDVKKPGLIVVLGIDPHFCTWCYILPESSRTLEDVYRRYRDKIHLSVLTSSSGGTKYCDTFWTKSQQMLFRVDINDAQVGHCKMFDVRFLISKS